jgi:hypothetical protein
LNLVLTKDALYQLSYSSLYGHAGETPETPCDPPKSFAPTFAGTHSLATPNWHTRFMDVQTPTQPHNYLKNTRTTSANTRFTSANTATADGNYSHTARPVAHDAIRHSTDSSRQHKGV